MTQTQERQTVSLENLDRGIAANQNYLLSSQYPEGYWWVELRSNVTITAEMVLLHTIWGTGGSRPLKKVENYLRHHQREHGGWELLSGESFRVYLNSDPLWFFPVLI